MSDLDKLGMEIANEIENEYVDPRADDQAKTHFSQNVQKDSSGVEFDPELHVAKEDGSPATTKTGKFRKKPLRIREREKEQKQEKEKEQKVEADSYNAAVAASSVFVSCGVAVFGDEWYPEKTECVDESQMLVKNFKDYFDARGVVDIPPGWALAIGMVSYAGRRFTKPKTKSKIQQIKEWIVTKIVKWKMGKNNAQADSRNNGERKNNFSKEAGKPSKG